MGNCLEISELLASADETLKGMLGDKVDNALFRNSVRALLVNLLPSRASFYEADFTYKLQDYGTYGSILNTLGFVGTHLDLRYP